MKHDRSSDTLLTPVLVFAVSSVLNYVWESVHEAFLYEVIKFKADDYIRMILEASLDDAIIILGIYLGVAVLWKDLHWLRDMKKAHLFAASAAGMIIAVLIEIRGVMILKKWSYLPAMPTISGIGLTPLVQIATTGLLTFWIVRRFLYPSG